MTRQDWHYRKFAFILTFQKNEERNKSEIKYKIHLFMRFWLSGLFHNSEILRKPSLNLYIINYIRFSEMKINVLKGLFSSLQI
jgi:hypothetical protein